MNVTPSKPTPEPSNGLPAEWAAVVERHALTPEQARRILQQRQQLAEAAQRSRERSGYVGPVEP